jgi:3-hydroxyisobutyrate dehydrogenase-like beta-hydroxyacid dehydrogenase
MGSAVGKALLEGGAQVVTTLDGRSERTARLAREAGIECLPGLDEVVGGADVVLSVAPPDQAEAIAHEVDAAAARLGARAILADLNAISPATAKRIQSAVAIDVVDGSISGPPPARAGTTRIYVSGPRADEIAALPFAGVDVIPVGDEVGSASAVKMCTASVYKGTVALLTEALLTALANGVLPFVLDDLGERAEGAARTIARSATKSARDMGEMHEIAATQAAAGLPPELFEAMATVYAAIATRPGARQAPEEIDAEPDLETVLRGLAPEPGR